MTSVCFNNIPILCTPKSSDAFHLEAKRLSSTRFQHRLLKYRWVCVLIYNLYSSHCVSSPFWIYGLLIEAHGISFNNSEAERMARKQPEFVSLPIRFLFWILILVKSQLSIMMMWFSEYIPENISKSVKIIVLKNLHVRTLSLKLAQLFSHRVALFFLVMWIFRVCLRTILDQTTQFSEKYNN